jgi:hypothetical protein
LKQVDVIVAFVVFVSLDHRTDERFVGSGIDQLLLVYCLILSVFVEQPRIPTRMRLYSIRPLTTPTDDLFDVAIYRFWLQLIVLFSL